MFRSLLIEDILNYGKVIRIHENVNASFPGLQFIRPSLL